MRDDLPVWRSLMFVPVNVEKFVKSGADRGADGIILDLEDSIAPSQKDSARTLIADAIPHVSRKGADVLVRVNRPWRIMVRDIDLPDLTPDNVGTFDTVLFAGVFYHLRHPFAMLEQVTKLAGRVFIVETQLDAMDQARPAMVFYPGRECNGDPTNWWGPNPACVDAMLRDLGFPHVVYTPHPDSPGGRGIFHAFRP